MLPYIVRQLSSHTVVKTSFHILVEFKVFKQIETCFGVCRLTRLIGHYEQLYK